MPALEEYLVVLKHSACDVSDQGSFDQLYSSNITLRLSNTTENLLRTEARTLLKLLGEFEEISKAEEAHLNLLKETYKASSTTQQKQLGASICFVAQQSLEWQRMGVAPNSPKMEALDAAQPVINYAITLYKNKKLNFNDLVNITSITADSTSSNELKAERLEVLHQTYQDPSRFGKLGLLLKNAIGHFVKLFNEKKGNAIIAEVEAESGMKGALKSHAEFFQPSDGKSGGKPGEENRDEQRSRAPRYGSGDDEIID